MLVLQDIAFLEVEVFWGPLLREVYAPAPIFPPVSLGYWHLIWEAPLKP